MSAPKSRWSFTQALPLAILALVPACGSSAKKDGGLDARAPWPWEVESPSAADADTVATADGPSAPRDAAQRTDSTADLPVHSDLALIDGLAEDAMPETGASQDADPYDAGGDLPDPGFSYLCGDGYLCLTNCENRCGMHDLGRSVCTCDSGLLHCTECLLTDLARPQVPKVVTTMCAADVATGGLCSRAGDACYLHANSPYPDGCLCWPTPSGLVWGCGPVFGWFTSTPDDPGSGT